MSGAVANDGSPSLVTDADDVLQAAVAMTHLPGGTALRLVALIEAFGAAGAWERILAGDPALLDVLTGAGARIGPVDLASWHSSAAAIRPERLLQRLASLGQRVLVRGGLHYPDVFLADPEPPAVLFARGDLTALGQPLAAIVGTRRASSLGLDTAFRLGADATRGGIGIVSGLALGIDGAAHNGALSIDGSRPIAVVGSGLDVVYPRQNRHLWDAVGERGLLLSEYPPGTRPLPERFPARNRLVAALSRVVVCVESHARGGALSTVERALERNRIVLAVPGPAISDYSEGSNRLLRQHHACLDATDIGAAVGWTIAAAGTVEPRPEPDAVATVVLGVLGWEPRTVDWILCHTGLGAGAVSLALYRLQDDLWVSHACGRWHRLAPPPIGRRFESRPVDTLPFGAFEVSAGLDP